VERPIDFSRKRYMLCGQCGRKWVVDLDWIDRWERALETCPGCGVTCEEETAPRVTVDPDDPALTDEKVSRLVWYHTSTQPNWPAHDFDPAAKLTKLTRQMMGGDDRVAQWAERQRSKALHVQAATEFTDTMKPEMWARYVMGLVDMLLAPEPVLTELDAQIIRYF